MARFSRNFRQLVQFCIVGGSGYVVNLAVFAVLLWLLGKHLYLTASMISFAVANISNYLLNRYWTFAHSETSAHTLAYARFLAVGLLSQLAVLIILHQLVVQADMNKVLAQAIAIVLVTPIGFIGNKLWTFSARP